MQLNFHFSKVVQKYKNKSYFIQNVILISLTILIPLIVILLTIYNISRDITKAEIQNANNNTLSLMSESIDSYLGTANVICSYLLNQNKSESNPISRAPVILNHQSVSKTNATIKNIQQIANATGFTGKITLIDSNQGRYYSNKGESGSYMNKDGLFPSSVLFQSPGWKNVTLLDQSVSLTYCQSLNGLYVMIQIPSDSIYSIVDKSLPNPYQVQIRNSGGQYIFQHSSQISEENFQISSSEKTLSEGEEIKTTIISPLTNLEYILLRPVDNYNNRYAYLKNIILILLVFSSVLVIALSVIVTRKIYKPISTILDLIKTSSQNSEWQSPVSPKDLDEIQYITKGLEQQKIYSEQTQRQLKQKIVDLKKAQALALQSQINSHFLYNYLENINWKAMVQIGEDNSISKMVGLLSKLLRLSLDNTRTLIPLKEELEHIRLYIESQCFRYDDQFTVEWKVDKSLLNCKVLKLSLQPIVENIFSHAIKGASKKIKICIRCFAQGEYLIIQIQDNGIGIPPDILAHLNNKIQSQNREFKEHIGLVNVAKRLSLLFDTPSPLIVESVYGEFTTVSVKITRIEN